MNDFETLRSELLEIMEKQNLSYLYIAKLAGINKINVWRFCTSRNNLGVESFFKVAKVIEELKKNT